MHMGSLKVFCDVVRFRSFSKGAVENHLSQSAASQMVHQLEDHLGVTLIDRSHRPWTITPEGKLYFEGCREVVHKYRELETKVKNLSDEATSVIRVSCIYSVGLRHMSTFKESFSKFHPNVRVHIEYLHPDKVYESVLNEEMDLGIVSFPKTSREFVVIPWKNETMVLACYPQHPLANMDKISVSDLSGESFIGFDKDLIIRKEIDRFLKQNDVEVNIVSEFDNIEAIKRAVEMGSGISILPRPTLDREMESGTISTIPFKSEALARPLGIIHRRGKKINDNTAQFIDLMLHDNEINTPTGVYSNY